jgi:hypothetical protein
MTAATDQPDRSPAPGVIFEPAHVRHDAPPTAASERQNENRLNRRNPVSLMAAKVMSAFRGDKHMVSAHPDTDREDAAPLDDAATNRGER